MHCCLMGKSQLGQSCVASTALPRDQLCAQQLLTWEKSLESRKPGWAGMWVGPHPLPCSGATSGPSSLLTQRPVWTVSFRKVSSSTLRLKENHSSTHTAPQGSSTQSCSGRN